MDEFHMSKILRDIAQKTYKTTKIPPFRLELYVEERKTFHGDYNPRTTTIRVFNMSRPTQHIISTTIHELAHHVDFSINGTSGHNKRFYGILKELMETAVKCGYINYESARKKMDSRDISQMEKYYGPVSASYDENYDTFKDVRIVKVYKSFPIKDWLKEADFHYNKIDKIWEKEVNKDEAEDLKNRILEQNQSVEVKVDKFNEIQVEAFYYVIVTKNTYPHKEELSANGYKYKGYYIDSNSWVKKIKTSELAREKRFLSSLGLEYSLKN